jgi:N-methylhydantoinase A/oxoprolinase/acetone carboxylase beta subunit
VTDADLAAGRLVAANFLGGQMKLYPERAERAVSRLAHAMKTNSLAAARGIIRVVNANMERAIRVITVERGYDPRDFALLAFGGAGPMHACELALDLGIRRIVMPRNPGLLCAWGASIAPLGREYSLTVRETNPNYRGLRARASGLVRRAHKELADEGASAIRHELWADVRYRGQSYELEIALTPRFIADFHSTHRRTFGHSSTTAAVEVVNIRIRAVARETAATPGEIARQAGKPSPVSIGPALVGSKERSVPIYDRESFGAGARVRGPAVVVELSSTAYVAPEFTLRVDDFGNLQLETSR